MSVFCSTRVPGAGGRRLRVRHAALLLSMLVAAACSGDPGVDFATGDAGAPDQGSRDVAQDRQESAPDAATVQRRDASAEVGPRDAGGGRDARNEPPNLDARPSDAPRDNGGQGSADARRDALVDAPREAARDVGVNADVGVLDGTSPPADRSDPSVDAASPTDDGASSVPLDGAPGEIVPDAAAFDSAAPPAPDASADIVSDAVAPPDPTPDAYPPLDPPADTSVPPPIDAPVEPPPVSGEVRRLNVVAHPDDDLLFMNPDLDAVIAAGATSRTVYMTSGDRSEGDWNSRETRVKAAHAAMAGVASDWSCSTVAYAAHGVVLCTLQAAPRVSTAFMRLRDTLLPPLWARANELPFAVDPVASEPTIDNANTYTHDDVVNVLRSMMTGFAPNRISTLDSTLAYGVDEHSDHVASAMFALTAAQAYGHLDSFTQYRGYTTAHELQNVAGAQLDRKASIMTTYAPYDPGSNYDIWVRRQYSIGNQLGTGALRQAGSCLDVSGTVAAGSGVVLSNCTASAATRWTTAADAHVRGPGGLCLAVRPDGSKGVQVATCADTPGQRWLWSVNGQLRGAEGTCLSAGDQESGVVADLCGRDDSNYGVPADQQWAR